MRSERLLLAAAVTFVTLAPSHVTARSADRPASGKGAQEAEPQAAASIDGTVITALEVDDMLRARLFELRNQEYAMRKQALEELIAKSLLAREAASRKIALAELEQTEVKAKAGAVTDAEIKKFYELNKARLQGRSEADGLAFVAASLKQERERERRTVFVAELRGKHDVRLLLPPPRLEVDEGGAPARGPAGAPVTIVEFSDFQCPYCGHVAPALKRVLESYGDRVRLVFRDYPLPIHPLAPKASEAAACARDQGQFWEMHDRLFANQGALQIDDLKRHATELGLQAAPFAECLDSGKHQPTVQKNGEYGNRLGITGTPAFFVNGRPLVGAQPYEKFVELIDEELGRKGIALPSSTAASK